MAPRKNVPYDNTSSAKATMKIHIARNGLSLGQFDEEQLTEQIEKGGVSYDDLAWTEGMAEWQPLRAICTPPQGTPPPPPTPPSPVSLRPVTGTPTTLPRIAPSSHTSGNNNRRIVSILAILFGIFFSILFSSMFADSVKTNEMPFLMIIGFLVGSAAAYGYLLPAWIAGVKRLPNFWFILLLNLVTGATGIAWLVCLFWVCLAKSPAKSVSVSSAS